MFTKEHAAKSAYNALRNDLFCEYCGKQCHNLNSLNNHQCRCSENLSKINSTGIAKFWKDVKQGKRTVWNKGLTKETSSSIRKYVEANSRIKTDLEIELDDDGRLYEKYMAKKQNDKFHEQRGFELSFSEYCTLVEEASIVSSQLGIQHGQGYVLARYDDQGPYKYGNCRFITQHDNLREMYHPSKRVEDLYRICMDSAHEATRAIFESGEHWVKTQIQTMLLVKDNQFKAARLFRETSSVHPSYAGKKNSQYGSFWITDGNVELKWREGNGAVPSGFRRGRIHKNVLFGCNEPKIE